MKPPGSILGFVAALIAVLSPFMATAVSISPEARRWVIKTWETDDGLPENSATAMVQTRDGYLWFGTFGGLVRFDGERFTVFDRSNTPDLPSDGIVNLHLDRRGRLWVSTIAGLVLQEGADWHQLRKLPTPSNDYIRTFTERANGDVLLTTFGGKILEFAHDRLTQLPPPPGEPGEGYLGGVDEDGAWWVVQNKFTGRWKENHWESTVPDNDLKTTERSSIGITSARDGGLWLLINTELRKYSHGTEVSRRQLSELPGQFWSMTEDSRSNIWICTVSQGICQILPSEGIVRWNEQNGVSYHGTRFVFEDREKNLWVGTSGGGLQRFKLSRFQTFGPESGLSERVVKSVYPAPGGGVWIATYGEGLFRWTQAGITNVPLEGWTNQHLYVQSVLSDRSARTWVGTFGGGLFMFDENGCRHFPTDQTGGGNVIALFEDSHGRIWVTGGQGVSAFDGGVFHVYDAQPDFPGSGVCCFGEDNTKAVWLSNLERVCYLQNERFVEVHDSEGRPLRGIVCLRGESDGSMWLGSTGAGLLRWKNGMLSHIDTENGLAVTSVHGILKDAQDYFWMPSNRGVMRAKRSDLESIADGTTTKLVCRLLDLNDGLPSVECPKGQQPTCARDAEGRLWFPTIKGAAVTDPASFHPNTIPPLADIQAVVYYPSPRDATGNDIASRKLDSPFAGPPQLPAGCHGIEIHYTAPGLSSPEKVQFQINLDGESWRDVGRRRVVYFDQLPAGPHQFRVRAANDDGLWDKTGASLTFSVLPFFWQTGWFRSLLIVCVCGLATAWVYRLKTNLESKRAVQEAFTRQLILSQENERKRVASELHDGLGQDLLLIKNRLALLSVNGAPEVARQLSEISATTSRAINDVRSISHALRPSALEQVGLTKAIEWMVEQIAETSPFKLSAESDNIDHLLSSEIEINLYRIIQEGLNNVIKHAHASQVILEIKRHPNAISVSMFDNGSGFDVEAVAPKAARHSGSGLGLISITERTKMLQGQVEIKSEPGIGTRLILHVPLPKVRK